MLKNIVKIFLINLSIFFCYSCTTKTDNYLNKGLFELQNKRPVDEPLIKGFDIETFGIIKSEEKEDTYDLVFLLNNDVAEEVVENYSVTIRVKPTKEEKEKNNITKSDLLWDFKPELIENNGHKYMIRTITSKLKKIEEFRFALYHREGYQGKTLSKVIIVNNMTLY